MEVYYGPLIFVTKLSILLQYLHIFAPIRKSRTYWAVYALIWINILYYTAFMVAILLLCQPFQKIWNPLGPGHCLSLIAINISTSSINIVSDFSILILPIYKILHLQLPRHRKAGIIAVFALGFLSANPSPPPTTLAYSLTHLPQRLYRQHNAPSLQHPILPHQRLDARSHSRIPMVASRSLAGHRLRLPACPTSLLTTLRGDRIHERRIERTRTSVVPGEEFRAEEVGRGGPVSRAGL